MQLLRFLLVKHGRPVLRSFFACLQFCGLILCNACSQQGLIHGNSDEPARQAREFQFRDGGSAIYFSFDKFNGSANRRAAIASYLFVISGSDCRSMQDYLPQYFRGLDGESGPLRIFILHKRHIQAGTALQQGRACSDDFIRADYPSRWLQDQGEFLQYWLAQAVQQGQAPQRVVIMGISEGAEIAPLLALRTPQATHLVLLANGGMQPLDSLRLLADKTGDAGMLQELARLDAAFTGPAPADPDAVASRINGRSWRYWSQLRELRHTENLLALSLPIFIGMGDADTALPVESASYIRQRFAAAGKGNLSVHIYPGADHGLRSEARFYLPDFMHQVDLWLQASRP